jgi:flagellar biogenesis protein FliO
MPAFTTIVLVAFCGVTAPFDDPPRVDRADYRAAFDDSADYAPPDSWQPPQAAERQIPAERQVTPSRQSASARLPLQFRADPNVRSDSELRPASALEPATLPQRASAGAAIRLAPPDATEGRRLPQFPGASPATILGSLGAVVGLFLIVAWVMRRGAPKGSGLLPREVVEVLGRTALVGRQQLQLLRLGSKLVLVSVSPTAVESVAEVTDPAEVDRLTGLCYQGHPHSATASFRQVIQSFEEPRAGYTTGRTPDLLDLSERDARGTRKEGTRGR